VIVEAKDKKGGLFRSDDAGATWKKATEDKRIEGYWYMSEIFVDPKIADIVYVPSQNLYRSNDGGHTFTAIKGAPGETIITACGSIQQIPSASCWEWTKEQRSA